MNHNVKNVNLIYSPQMAKKRRVPRHTFKYLYETPDADSNTVKGEFKYKPRKFASEAKKLKRAELTAKADIQKVIKQDIVKSLALASLILSLELVLYFLWE